jgi:hypothetical protein
MPTQSTFAILLLIARPAAGKSEIIDYLKRTPGEERARRFHIADFAEIDDFPMLWAWFEEDHLLNEMGQPRLHTDAEGYFTAQYLWDLLIRRMCLEYTKLQRQNPPETVVMEFSRGMEHGGYASAFAHLTPQVVEKMAVLYVNVTWEESLRKNRKRFNPERPDSILEHSLPDAKLERLYRDSDWSAVSNADAHFLTIQGRRVPYAVFENEDDVTSGHGQALGSRLEDCLERLWRLSNSNPNSPW